MRVRPSFIVALLVCMAAVPALADSAVTATPATPFPTQTITVGGTGFGVGEPVDIFLDTTDTALLAADSSGTFSGPVKVPLSTSPGQHTVTAVGRSTGDTAQATITVTTPWRQFGFGVTHRGFNPYETTLGVAGATNLSQVWANTDLRSNGSTPNVVGSTVYVTTTAGVAALDATTGATRWHVLPHQTFYSSPASGTYVYVTTMSGYIFALDPNAGFIVWRHRLGGSIQSSPSLANGIVYFGSDDNLTLYALSATGGRIKWSYTTGGMIRSTPTVVDNVVYFGSFDGKVYALNASTGALIWSYQTGTFVESSAAVVKGVVYVGSQDGKVYALDAKLGSLVWSQDIGTAFATPAVANDVVYIGASDGNMYALNAGTGAVRWKTKTSSAAIRSASVANGVVYFLDNGNNFTALDASNGAILSTGPGFGYLGAPAISDGVVYVNATGQPIYALAPGSVASARAKGPKQPPKRSDLHPDLNLVVQRQR